MTASPDATPTAPAGPSVNGDGPTTNPNQLTADIGQEAERIVDAICEGGPHTLPAELRSHRVPLREHKIKVRHHGGYEHFERQDGPIVDGTPLVFRWSGRTRIAE